MVGRNLPSFSYRTLFYLKPLFLTQRWDSGLMLIWSVSRRSWKTGNELHYSRKENLTFSLLANTCDWGKYVTAEYFGTFKEVEKWEEKKPQTCCISTRPRGNYFIENNEPDSAPSYTQAVICFLWSLWRSCILLFPAYAGHSEEMKKPS